MKTKKPAKKTRQKKPRADRTDKELKELAKDAIAGKIFCSDQIRASEAKQMMPMVFMTLALSPPKFLKELKTDNVVHLYEYLKDAVPRSVNGYPIFMSHRTLTKTEYEKFRSYEKAMRAAMDDVK